MHATSGACDVRLLLVLSLLAARAPAPFQHVCSTCLRAPRAFSRARVWSIPPCARCSDQTIRARALLVDGTTLARAGGRAGTNSSAAPAPARTATGAAMRDGVPSDGTRAGNRVDALVFAARRASGWNASSTAVASWICASRGHPSCVVSRAHPTPRRADERSSSDCMLTPVLWCRSLRHPHPYTAPCIWPPRPVSQYGSRQLRIRPQQVTV